MTAPLLLALPSRAAAACLCVGLGLAACATPNDGVTQRREPLPDQGQAKAGNKDEAAPPAVAPVAAPAPEPTGPTIDELLAFIRTHTSPQSNFGEVDHQFVQALESHPQSGSVAEAAIVIGVLRTVLSPRNLETSTFKEADLDSQDDPVSVKSVSLERLAQDRGVNIADALVENPLLGSYGAAKQAFAALEAGAGSPEFKTEILLALKRQSGLWNELGASLTSAMQPPPPVADDDGDAPPNPADLHGGDSILSEAQALADRGNFLAAIKKAHTIGPANPMHPMAEEKVKEFSKSAVQELRAKAAQAFQTAAPVTDARTKANYLKQAKTYLEDAIKNYPDAPQLPTVRDNLRAISRDLEKLESEKPGH